MLVNISDAKAVQSLLQRKFLLPDHLYRTSGQRFNPSVRVPGEGFVALENELSQSTLLYLRANDLFEELECCYKVLSKALMEEDPDGFVQVIDELAERIQQIAVHYFDLAYAYLAWHTSDDYPVMHHLLVALTFVRVGMCSKQFSDGELMSHLKAALTMNISMLSLQARLREQAEPLSSDQRETIRRHPEQSANKLKLLGVRDEVWIESVRMHHELPDGSGYPSSIPNKNEGSVLLSVCDSFNARMAQRDYRNNYTAEQTLKDLFAQGVLLYSSFTSIILEQLGVYPPGSLVQLMGNQIACSLIRGETAISPVVLAFRNMPTPGPNAALVDTSIEANKIRSALPRRDLGQLPSLLTLVSKIV